MDPIQLCHFFNRLQVLVNAPAALALAELLHQLRALHSLGHAAAFVVVRDGVASLVLSFSGLAVAERYGMLRKILTAGSLQKLTQAISDHAGLRVAIDPRVTATLAFILVACHDRHRCGLVHLAKRVTLSPWHLSRLVRRAPRNLIQP